MNSINVFIKVLILLRYKLIVHIHKVNYLALKNYQSFAIRPLLNHHILFRLLLMPTITHFPINFLILNFFVIKEKYQFCFNRKQILKQFLQLY